MRTALATLAVLIGSTAALAQVSVEKADDKKAETKPTRPECFMMGGPIYFNWTAATDEGPVYFCCEGCVKTFQKDMPTEDYDEYIAAQRAAIAKLPKVQVACPLSGDALGEDAPTVEHAGAKVKFCCEGCKGRFAKSPEKFAGKLAAAYTYQTKCPISGNPISPAAGVELENGAHIYACCDGCAKKIAAEPAKFAKALKEQGYFYKPTDLKAKKPKGD